MALTSPPAHAPRPDSCAVAYKEWAGVCHALGTGRQTIVLRKGGISEAGGVFRPEHAAFWLYPTRVHQAQQGLREPAPPIPATPEGSVDLDLLAVVESVERVEQIEDLPRLDEFHVWTEETVRSRFAYRSPGLWVMGLRIYRRSPGWRVSIAPEHAGCKTWVSLDGPLDADGAVPVLDDDEAERRRRALATALGLSAARPS